TPCPPSPSWHIVSSPNHGTSNNYLYGVGAVSATDVWAVGYYQDDTSFLNQTLVQHWNGTALSVIASPNQGAGENYLNGVGAVSDSYVWAVDYSDTATTSQTLVQHWNGTAWSIVSSPSPSTTGNYLKGVSVVSATDVWAVGDSLNAAF